MVVLIGLLIQFYNVTLQTICLQTQLIRARTTIQAASLCSQSTADRTLEIVKMLVEAGADVHGRDRLGFTPIDWACRWSLVEVMKYLVAKGIPGIGTRRLLYAG